MKKLVTFFSASSVTRKAAEELATKRAIYDTCSRLEG